MKFFKAITFLVMLSLASVTMAKVIDSEKLSEWERRSVSVMMSEFSTILAKWYVEPSTRAFVNGYNVLKTNEALAEYKQNHGACVYKSTPVCVSEERYTDEKLLPLNENGTIICSYKALCDKNSIQGVVTFEPVSDKSVKINGFYMK